MPIMRILLTSYGDDNEIICGHVETSQSDNECQKQSPGGVL